MPQERGSSGQSTVLARLRVAFPDSSERRRKQWLAAGRVTVNDRVVRDPREPVGPDDVVALGSEGRPVFPPPLRPLYEDDDLLVFEKPAGLLTIATERERHRTAYRLLWDYLAAQHPPRRPFVVHRLDRETSGLLVIAKSVTVKRRLQAQFAARTVGRVYVALVEGTVRAAAGTLLSSIVQDRARRVRSVSTHARGPRGARPPRPAITHYRVLERRRGATLLELDLGTGRRRQIRVQLAARGHPIVGDTEYGAREDRRSPLRRLALHATRLRFVHPVTGASMSFDSPPPAVLAQSSAAGQDRR